MKRVYPFIMIFTLMLLGACKYNSISEWRYQRYHQRKLANTLMKIVDSTGTKPKDLARIIQAKLIDKNGKISSSSLKEAFSRYVSNLQDEDRDHYPIFEIKNTNKVVVSVNGMGLWEEVWGLILVDKSNLKVLQVAFDHRSETEALGANIVYPSFTDQFIGTTISFTQLSYSLLGSQRLKSNGLFQVDGVSGATITSEGVVKMLNEDLMKYKAYFL